MIRLLNTGILLAVLLFLPTLATADISVPMHLVDSNGQPAALGSVTITESTYGVVFTPSLSGLPPGPHGFHLHQNPSCAAKVKAEQTVPALAAGGHYDPTHSGHHGSPWGNGHLGDLPVLTVDAEGQAQTPVNAPRLKLSDVHGRALMIHAGSDNYADQPNRLGGGGRRIACGVIN